MQICLQMCFRVLCELGLRPRVNDGQPNGVMYVSALTVTMGYLPI